MARLGLWSRRMAALLVVIAVALAARMIGTAAMRLPDGGVRPVSSDSHYYLRRIVATYQNFPQVPDVDAGLGCPDATVPPWPGGVERLTAGLARLVVAPDAPPREVERFAAWLPVAAGVLAAAAVCALAMAWLGTLAGLLAGLLLALLPLHIWYTAFAFIDHHMLLTLWLAGLAWAVDVLLRLPGRRQAALLGVILASGYALMTEAWIAELVVTLAAVLTAATAVPVGPMRRQVLRALLLAVVLGALLATPAIVAAPYFQHGLVAANAPSRFTLWLLGGFSVALGAGWLAVGANADRRWRALCVAALVGAGTIALVAVVDPAMRQAFAAMLDFSGRAGMVATIEESKPFWRQPFPQPLIVLGGAIVLLPLLPLGFSRLPPLRRAWLTWLYIATAALALLQTRFGLVFAVPYVLAWAGVLTGQTPRFTKTLAVIAALGALALVPPLVTAEHWSPHEESVWRTLAWMQKSLPPPEKTGQRCVLGPWDVGHKILHVTGQPVIASNFTELKERDALRDSMRVLLADDFRHAEPLLQRRQVKWLWTMATPWPVLMANAEEIGQPPPDLARARAYVGTRLLMDAGTAHGDAAGTGTLRRIHVSPLELPAMWHGQVQGPLREIALFERVKGAVLVGDAHAGARVTATIEVKHPGAPAFSFTQAGDAAADGHYALRVPYATTGMPFGLVATSKWRVTVAGGAPGEVDVPESVVQQGLEVPVP
jgi:asparagine N-glycosylation enzyme membrane subunit Stt3